MTPRSRVHFSADLGGYRILSIAEQPFMVQCIRCQKFIHEIQPDDDPYLPYSVAGLHQSECPRRPNADN